LAGKECSVPSIFANAAHESRSDRFKLDDEDILRLNQAMLVFLGMAVSPRAKGEV
jgi:hypothetical protein